MITVEGKVNFEQSDDIIDKKESASLAGYY